MNTNLPTPGERIVKARERLFEVLDPRTEPEREICRWLGSMLAPAHGLDTLLSMIERAERRHLVDDQLGKLVAEAYNKGWSEAVGYCRTQQARGVLPVLWDDEAGGGQ